MLMNVKIKQKKTEIESVVKQELFRKKKEEEERKDILCL